MLFRSRDTRVINTGGEKVFAEEVEQVLQQHPGVDDAYVVGVPDERWGNRIAAVVATGAAEPPTAGELTEFVASRLARYKAPLGRRRRRAEAQPRGQGRPALGPADDRDRLRRRRRRGRDMTAPASAATTATGVEGVKALEGRRVNYGCDKVRFPAPVPVGARLRAGARIDAVTEATGGVQSVVTLTFEAEGQEKPSCVATILLRHYL